MRASNSVCIAYACGGRVGGVWDCQSILSHCPFLSKLSNSNEKSDSSKSVSVSMSMFLLLDENDWWRCSRCCRAGDVCTRILLRVNLLIVPVPVLLSRRNIVKAETDGAVVAIIIATSNNNIACSDDGKLNTNEPINIFVGTIDRD